MDLSVGLLGNPHEMVVGFPRMSDPKESEADTAVSLYGLVLEITRCAVSVVSYSCGRGLQGCDYQEAKITGAILEWLSQPLTDIISK